jgi:hypothetical protein
VATLRLGLRVEIGAQNKETCSGCRVSLTTRTRSSPSLAENAARIFATSPLSTVKW